MGEQHKTMNNTTTEWWDARISLTIGVLSTALALFTILGNSIVCLAVYKDPIKCFRNPTSYLILNLALGDLLTGAVDTLYAGYYLHDYLVEDLKQIYNVAEVLSFVSINVSTITMVILSLDRYIAICRPLQYKELVTTKRVFLLNGIAWCYSIFFSLLPQMGVPHSLYYLIDVHLHVTSSLVLMTVIFVLVFRSFKKQVLLSLKWNGNTTSNNLRFRREMLMVGTIFVVLCANFFCLLPYYIIAHLYSLCANCRSRHSYIWVESISEPIEFMNSCLNPIFYAWRLPKYRKAFLKTLGCKEGRVECSCREIIGEFETTLAASNARHQGTPVGKSHSSVRMASANTSPVVQRNDKNEVKEE